MTTEEPATGLPWWPSPETRRTAAAERRRARRNERPPERAGQPRGKTSLDEVIEAALRIVDAEGLEALTLRRLAAELGVGAMTVYSYVRDKDELLDLVVDRAVAEVALPPPDGDWRDRARALARNLRTTLLAHPSGMRLISERPMRGPNSFRLLDAGLGIFRNAGFSDEQAADAYPALGNYVLGHVLAETTALSPHLQSDEASGQPATLLASVVQRLPPEHFPNVTALAPYLYDEASASSATDRSSESARSRRRFEFGLESLILGLAAMRRGEGSGG